MLSIPLQCRENRECKGKTAKGGLRNSRLTGYGRKLHNSLYYVNKCNRLHKGLCLKVENRGIFWGMGLHKKLTNNKRKVGYFVDFAAKT